VGNDNQLYQIVEEKEERSVYLRNSSWSRMNVRSWLLIQKVDRYALGVVLCVSAVSNA